MTTAKTPAQRVKDSNARKVAAGMKTVRSLWAYPQDIPAIRAYAAELAAKRPPAAPASRASA
jgi:hypothetical protein